MIGKLAFDFLMYWLYVRWNCSRLH